MENSRLEQPVIKRYHETVSALTSVSGGTTTLDLSAGNVFQLVHSADTTIALSNVPATSGVATTITIVRKKDNSSTARTITWPSSFKWSSGASPTLTSTANATDIITAISKDNGTTWYAFAVTAYATPHTSNLFAWGWGDFGQVPDGTTDSRSSPVQIGTLMNWVRTGGMYRSGLAVKTDGTLWAWGLNDSGQLGDGSTNNRSSPVQIAGTTWYIPTSRSSNHALVVKNEGGSTGSLWAWGNNGTGRVGDGSTNNRSSPVQVGTLTTWISASGGQAHAVALRSDNTVWAWGAGSNGRLGQVSNTTNRSSPVQVSGTTWSFVVAGGTHSIALRTDGTLWAWGLNSSGQLGQVSNTTSRSSPVQVGTLATWSFAAGAHSATAAIKTDGTLWTWGNNNTGQLGQGSITNRSSPVQVGTLANWSQVYGGYAHFAASKIDGTLWAWGSGDNGRLGQVSDIDARSSPVQVGTLATWGSFSAMGDGVMGLLL